MNRLRVSRFHLREGEGGAIAACMNVRAACLFASLLVLSGCEEKKEVTVTETRKETSRDGKPKLFATSDERFPDARPSPVKGDTPDGWLAVPATQMRLLNYRFGESGTGEVWVSLSQGSVLDNVNRWFKQFGTDSVDESGLRKLPPAMLAGSPGVWVSAEGIYAGGMGTEPKTGFALSGVIAPVGGQILTVKMVGPKAEVLAARPTLEAYAKSIRLAE